HRPRFMLRGVTSNWISWSGMYRSTELAVPPYMKSAPAGPRKAALAACTRSLTRMRRMRSRSASNRSGESATGHQGPSLNEAIGSATCAALTSSVASRGTYAPESTLNVQFSPSAHGAFGTPRPGGFGPYVVHGPGPVSALFGRSCGGSGSPKYENSSLTTLSTTGKSVWYPSKYIN